MIKLLVCDVDGTLLEYNQKNINYDIIKLLSDIADKNIHIAIASGRSYPDLKRLFGALSDKLYFICHDGALCIRKDKKLYRKSIPGQTVYDFIKKYAGIYKCTALYSDNKCYVIGDVNYTKGENSIEIKNCFDIKEQIYKLAVYDEPDVSVKELFSEASRLRICSHSGGCLEYVLLFADKGAALCDLQNRLFLTKFDTAAIGNDSNDIPMLRNASYSAAIAPYGSDILLYASQKAENAVDFLKEIARQ